MKKVSFLDNYYQIPMVVWSGTRKKGQLMRICVLEKSYASAVKRAKTILSHQQFNFEIFVSDYSFIKQAVLQWNEYSMDKWELTSCYHEAMLRIFLQERLENSKEMPLLILVKTRQVIHARINKKKH